MSFFTSSLALTLASVLDISNTETHTQDVKEQVRLDDFSAIQKELIRTECVRPMVQGVVSLNIKSITVFPLAGI